METRTLRALEVSAVGIGCNNFGRRLDIDGTRAVVDAALEEGITLFDTAAAYGSPAGESERQLGEALGGRRDNAVVATKFGWDDGSPENARNSADTSLERLGTDRIDLFQYHRPDPEVPIAETLGAMSELVDAGKVLHLGVSNFDAAQLREAHETVGDRLVSLQNEYSLLEREIEAEVVPECERLGVGILPYFPLASGKLTGKYRRGEPAPEGTRLHGRDQIADDETFDRIERLVEFARERGLEPIDVAVAGLAAQPMVASVIAGATKPEQVRANAAALRWKPSRDDLAELDGMFPPGR
jgi:aryl-alcohol dehydrogenase-like predicted oxidoreductase